MAATDADATPDAPTDDAAGPVPRSARWFVGVLFVLLLVPGVIGFDAWPLTGWRLFSLSRDESQNRWIVQAVDADGEVSTVSLEELPLGYRHAEWPMAELPGASEARRQRVCQALADEVGQVRPGTTEVRVAKDAQTLVERDGEWVVTHEPEVVAACRPASTAEPAPERGALRPHSGAGWPGVGWVGS